MKPLGTFGKLGAILVPWVFLCLFAALYLLFLVPRMAEGHPAALCMGAFACVVFITFCVAAVTFSRDVLIGQWPERARR